MIKCISFYEDVWLPRGADRQQWNHVVGAFGGAYELFDYRGWVWDPSMAEGGTVIVFDELGNTDLSTFVHPENACYLFGITGMNQGELVQYAEHVVRITTPVEKSLWGCQAAAMALYDRLSKG
jgi:hypothetical protein